MKRLDQQLDRDTIVIADVGDALFAATELTTHERSEFLSPAYYTSMGFGVPATLGALTARPDHRVVCLVGDGAFQMTGNELSSIVRYGLSPIVIVLDNQGYGTERFLHAGDWAFNDINPWHYHRLPEVLGHGKGYLIETEGDFDRALRIAWDDRSQWHLLHIKLSKDDASETLKRLAARLGQRVAGGKIN
jgi:indolepyruvate decarboxylase